MLILSDSKSNTGTDSLLEVSRTYIPNTNATNDPGILSETVHDYQILVFNNFPPGDLDAYQKTNLKRFIEAGGAVLAIGNAGLPKYHWPWFSYQIGAYVKPPVERLANNEDRIGLNPIGPFFEVSDTFLKPLIVLDSVQIENQFAPLSWLTKDEHLGYIALLSTKQELFNQVYEKTLKRIISNRLQLNYDACETHPVPQENRFVRSILAQNLYEPMELEILPDGKVLIIERRGLIKLYDPVTKLMNIVTKMDVHHEHEDGLIGIAADPDYQFNKWIYLFYSLDGPVAKQHISRFVFDNNRLYKETEKVLLEIPTQREECCHSAGCLEFGPDGLLYIATGDDTNPFASDGYAPIDERPGRKPWDAQRTAGNTNDLRGKILRIKPEFDGSYSIPDGNLFPPGEPNTRPEIYIMGCRNPFRLSIDEKTNYLYWGDIGPDAGFTSAERGPKGLDELNQAREAGNWGWPFTRGNNQSYFDYNFEFEESGDLFDPANLVNTSPNNTGKQQIPAARESMIWYSYDHSEEFPWVGTGGKNPMAGPLYYSDRYANAPGRFPAYFNGKLFFYEWMRDYIYIIHLDTLDRFMQADPFMPNSLFSNPMDMKFGPDGALYIIEYGDSWYTRNIDARLNKISFVPDNRQPVARIEADRENGAVPLTVQFSGSGSRDFDGDSLRYEWDFGSSPAATSYEKDPQFTFTEPGLYQVRLKVTDPMGAGGHAYREIFAGNDPPEIAIDLFGKSTFYWDNREMKYRVTVTDMEDGSISDGSIDPENVMVTFDYLPEGQDLTEIIQGHQANLLSPGAALIATSDCNTCHAADRKINGPSYREIAERYSIGDIPLLIEKVQKGGAGVWGETVMSAHPQLSVETIEEMIEYILSLKPQSDPTGRIPVEGTQIFNQHLDDETPGNYILTVSYTDQGAGALKPITRQEALVFTPPWIEAESYTTSNHSIRSVDFAETTLLVELKDDYRIQYDKVNLTGVTGLGLRSAYSGRNACAGIVRFEALRNDSTTLLGEIDVTFNPSDFQVKTWETPIPAVRGPYNLIISFHNAEDPEQIIANMDKILLFFDQDMNQLSF